MSEQLQSAIEPKDAIRIAKAHIASLFDDENVRNIGLEELAYDDDTHTYRVTVGFNRPWDMAPATSAFAAYATVLALAERSAAPALGRTFKVVTIDAKEGRVISMTNRPD